MKNKKQNIKNLRIILDGVIKDMHENVDKLSLSEKFDLDEIYADKPHDVELEDEDAFIVHCMAVKHTLITIMYAINHPYLLEKIKEFTTIESMKHEIANSDISDEVIDTFLDYVNFAKSRDIN